MRHVAAHLDRDRLPDADLVTINISGRHPGRPVPITHLLEDALGSGGASVFEWVAMIALFAGGLANMAAASRRPRCPGTTCCPGRRLTKVSPTTHSPSARWSPHARQRPAGHRRDLHRHRGHDPDRRHGVGRLLPSALTIAAVIWAARSGRLSGQSTFDLNRSAMPVRWAALVWSIFVVGVLTVPDVNHKTAMMAGGFFVLAAIWYAAPAARRHRPRRGRDAGPADRPAEPVAPSDPATTVPEQA